MRQEKFGPEFSLPISLLAILGIITGFYNEYSFSILGKRDKTYIIMNALP